jgi:SAM-dependent methyltransferase
MLKKIAHRIASGRRTWDPIKYWSGRASDPGSQSVMWANRAYNELVDRDEWKVIEQYLPEERGAVLDLGCGTGRMSQRLADRFGGYTGVDLDPMVQEARRRNPGLAGRYLAATIADYSYPSEAFDLILSLGCLATACSAETLEPTLRRVLGSLRPGGRLMLIEPFHRNWLLTRGCRLTGKEVAQLVQRLGARLITFEGMLLPLTRFVLSERPFEGLSTITRLGYEAGELIVRLRPEPLSDYKVIVATRGEGVL